MQFRGIKLWQGVILLSLVVFASIALLVDTARESNLKSELTPAQNQSARSCIETYFPTREVNGVTYRVLTDQCGNEKLVQYFDVGNIPLHYKGGPTHPDGAGFYLCMQQYFPNNYVCGDGKRAILEEECDDGNTIDGDGCSANCLVELPQPQCIFACPPPVPIGSCNPQDPTANSFCQGLANNQNCGTATCVATNAAGTTGECECQTNCGTCGDGNLDPGEECDEGADNGTLGANCTSSCRLPVCPIPQPGAVPMSYQSNMQNLLASVTIPSVPEAECRKPRGGTPQYDSTGTYCRCDCEKPNELLTYPKDGKQYCMAPCPVGTKRNSSTLGCDPICPPDEVYDPTTDTCIKPFTCTPEQKGNRGATTTSCRKQCSRFHTEEDVEQCVAACVCECDPTTGAGGGGGADGGAPAPAAANLLAAEDPKGGEPAPEGGKDDGGGGKGGAAGECYFYCMNRKPHRAGKKRCSVDGGLADCCRAGCIEKECPAERDPHTGETGIGGGGPPPGGGGAPGLPGGGGGGNTNTTNGGGGGKKGSGGGNGGSVPGPSPRPSPGPQPQAQCPAPNFSCYWGSPLCCDGRTQCPTCPNQMDSCNPTRALTCVNNQCVMTCSPSGQDSCSSDADCTGGSLTCDEGTFQCGVQCCPNEFQCHNGDCFVRPNPEPAVESNTSSSSAGAGVCGDGTRDTQRSCPTFAFFRNFLASIFGTGGGSQCRWVGEQCDDGNTFDGDGCDSQCRAEVCGNGILQEGEECDAGLDNDSENSLCRSDCTQMVCGDGIVDVNAHCRPTEDGQWCNGYEEQCDLGAQNGVEGSGCRSDCTAQVCGDGIIDAAMGEECDSEGERGVCANGQVCGNCECQDASAPRCGDGVVNLPYEECDAPDGNSFAPNASCRPGCKLPYCGDGTIDSANGEECDDRNTLGGDGCSPLCTIEKHFACVDDACTLVDGGGPNTCDPLLSCATDTHTECRNNACVEVDGPGANECDLGIPCNQHTVCSNNQCVLVDDTNTNYGECCRDVVIGTETGYTTQEGCHETLRNNCPVFGSTVSFAFDRDVSGQCCNATGTLCQLRAYSQCPVGQGGAMFIPSDSEQQGTCTTPDGTLQTTYEYCQWYGSATFRPNTDGNIPNACRTDVDCAQTACSEMTCPAIELSECQRHTENDPLCVTGADGNETCVQAGQCYQYTQACVSDACSQVLELCSDCPDPAPVTCGNGVVDEGEECDTGDQRSDTRRNACRTNCTFATCGDSVVDTGEECDNGSRNTDDPVVPGATCRTDCRPQRCGDGIVDEWWEVGQNVGEICDDGNDIDDDACSNSCKPNFCGDGKIAQGLGETCDLGTTCHTFVINEQGQTQRYECSDCNAINLFTPYTPYKPECRNRSAIECLGVDDGLPQNPGACTPEAAKNCADPNKRFCTQKDAGELVYAGRWDNWMTLQELDTDTRNALIENPQYEDYQRGTCSSCVFTTKRLACVGQTCQVVEEDGPNDEGCNAMGDRCTPPPEPPDPINRTDGGETGGQDDGGDDSGDDDGGDDGGEEGPTHTVCTENNECVTAEGEGDNECTDAIKCGTHAVCENEQCVIKDGPGDIECEKPEDCREEPPVQTSSAASVSSTPVVPEETHTVCDDYACIEVVGEGEDECVNDFGCGVETHTRCADNACDVVIGPGPNECLNYTDCLVHTECRDNQCVTVEGAGSNECDSDLGCRTKEEGGRLVCVNLACTAIPQSGPNKCDADADCAQHTQCIGEQCRAVLGEGNNECTSAVDCGGSQEGEFHTQCVNLQCVILNGAGTNECSDDEQCEQGVSHTVCENSQCTTKQGPGTNECSTDAECEDEYVSHTVCEDYQCKIKEGPGTNECDIALDCAPQRSVCRANSCEQITAAGANECSGEINCLQHTVCRDNQCIVVDGEGENECNTDLGCGEETHGACRGNQCVILYGPGANECDSPADCIGVSTSSSSSSSSSTSSSSRASSFASGPHLSSSPTTSSLPTSSVPTSSVPTSSVPTSSVPTSSRPTSSRPSTTDDDDGSGDDDDGIADNDDDDRNGIDLDGDGIIDVSLSDLVASGVICGDGALDAGEECDDSNRRDGDGCSSSCLLEIGVCGDGIIQRLLGEQCEQSLHASTLPYECKNCRFHSLSCGDGTIDPGEECDNGNENSNEPNASCREDCSLARCGDGIVDSVERCDDGNRIGGDGCDRFCALEDGTRVPPQPIVEGGAAFPRNPLQGTVPFGTQFPQQATTQPLPFPLPLAQLQPLTQSKPPVGDTGPAAIAVIGAGAAAGFGWVRRKKRGKK